MDEFITNTINPAEVCRRVKENVSIGEKEEIKGVMKRLFLDMAFKKEKLKMGIANKITEAEKTETKRVSKAEKSKQRSEDRDEVDHRARTQREEEDGKKKAEWMVIEEEFKQQEYKRQAASAPEQLEKEQARVISE